MYDVNKQFSLEGKVALVTGAAYGIGFAIQFAYGYIASATTFAITPFVLLAAGLGVIIATVVTLKALKNKAISKRKDF